MTLPIMDGHGNIHRLSGPGGGQFAGRPTAPPVAPLSGAADTRRARVRIGWRHPLNPANDDIPVDLPGDSRRKREGLSWYRRGRGTTSPSSRAVDVRSFVTHVSIPTYASHQAPITITVDGVSSGDEVAREYRAVDGKLFRQVWGIEDPGTGQVSPVVPPSASWAPTESGRAYGLRPVPADAEWLTQETERTPPVAAETEERAAQIAQELVSGYASIDGDVWQVTKAPVYRAPIVEDTPLTAPLMVAVTPALDTSVAAADLGHYSADNYDHGQRPRNPPPPRRIACRLARGAYQLRYFQRSDRLGSAADQPQSGVLLCASRRPVWRRSCVRGS